MTADVHAVAAIFDGAADAADGIRCFEHYGLNAGASKKLQRGGKAGRTSANDKSSGHAR